MDYIIPKLPLPIDPETKPILKKLAKAHQALAELKGVSGIIPNSPYAQQEAYGPFENCR